MVKVYYILKLKALSPLRIGGAGKENSDSDLLLNGKGMPFIPGSSLAGVLRDKFTSKEDVRELFGYVDKADAVNSIAASAASRVIVNDGVLSDDVSEKDVTITVRDGVGLDEWGMSVKSAKYDFEIAETDKAFTSVIECDFDTVSQRDKFEAVLADVKNNGICLGARTSRGYGRMECKVRKKEFDMSTEISEWLEFNPYNGNSFDDYDEIELDSIATSDLVINMGLKLDGAFIIRVKEANAIVREDGTNPDNVTIKNYRLEPVITGTSWAGSFRHHMLSVNNELKQAIVKNEEIDRFFGKGKMGNDSTKSNITFFESVIKEGSSLVTMRNSIDRFTAGTTTSSLFTDESWHGGETNLEIHVGKANNLGALLKMLSIAIMDLNNGLMTIGGGASIGKGVIQINSITVNGKDVTNKLNDNSLDLGGVDNEL